MRTLIDIPDDRIALLNAMARNEKVSRAAIVREGIDMVIEARQKADRAALADVFGSWKDLGIDGLAYQRKIRAEWDDDAEPADLYG